MPKIPDFDSFNYFETLFHNAQENTVLLIDEEGMVIAVNDAFTRAFGYHSDDIIGNSMDILFTEADQMKGMPEKELKSVLTTGQGADNNYLVSKQGKLIWVSGESVLVESKEGQKCILKIIQNIHQQKISELALQSMNEFNESILSSIEDVVLVIDKNMHVVKANKAISTIFKFNEPDFEKINFGDLIRPYDVFDEVQNSIQNAVSTKKSFSNIPIEIETASGEKRVFDVSCGNMQHTDWENNVLVVIHDITVHKQVEREREDVIGFVAHELRNPLANLVLCNEIMSEAIKENNYEEINDMLQRSKNNVSRLNKMIAELYDATRVNSGNLILDISTFNFRKMVDEAIETIQGLQPLYNIIVNGDGNFSVQGDKYRIIQVVTNYLSNGIKYSNGKTNVTLTITHNDKTVTVSVKDEGLGISKKQLPFIFDRFFRAENTRNLEGIGLGLYLCRQIIHAHKGHVWAESEEGKGSTFYFSIPF
ncbi:MAG: PAS domain-containing sensor histidine kinase [Bacteroidota bacterium]|nr:PAS domain-containing sensor histidine kinase [Bacteroidota bacterium]